MIKPHNQQFKASKRWLQKFMLRHSLSLCSKTSISQKLPIQLESKLQGFLNKIRVLRERHGYSSDMIINTDEMPMFFNLVLRRQLRKKREKENVRKK
jgi:hypothetical protein